MQKVYCLGVHFFKKNCSMKMYKKLYFQIKSHAIRCYFNCMKYIIVVTSEIMENNNDFIELQSNFKRTHLEVNLANIFKQFLF